MKNNKGITLASLVVYIIVMSIAIGIIGGILVQFNKNNVELNKASKDILEFNNFNTYFLKEIKSKQNKVDTINDNYILFSSGNSFSLVDNKINYNDIKICKDVQKLTFKVDENDNSIITVTIVFKDFSKTMQYKIEEIY